MEINITKFFKTAYPRDYSASRAEIGDNAGPDTWRAAMDDAEDWGYITDDNADAWRACVRSSGGWNDKEIAAFTMQELNALFIQWVAGDIRDGGLDAGTTWKQYQKDAEAGRVSGSLFQNGDDVYWSGE